MSKNLDKIVENYRNKDTKIKKQKKMTILLTKEETDELNKNQKPSEISYYRKSVVSYKVGNKKYTIIRTFHK